MRCKRRSQPKEKRICTRRQPYRNPNGGYFRLDGTNTPNQAHAARFDFHLARREGPADEIYVELKCINQSTVNPDIDAWNRYGADIRKLKTIARASGQGALPSIALLTGGPCARPFFSFGCLEDSHRYRG
jgi:hypothetical protein